MDTGSGVAMEYHDRVPFAFTATIDKVVVTYID